MLDTALVSYIERCNRKLSTLSFYICYLFYILHGLLRHRSKHFSHFLLVFLMLTLNKYMFTDILYSAYCTDEIQP